MTPQTEQQIREIFMSIPELSDRVFLLIMIRNFPLEMSNLARKLLKSLEI